MPAILQGEEQPAKQIRYEVASLANKETCVSYVYEMKTKYILCKAYMPYYLYRVLWSVEGKSKHYVLRDVDIVFVHFIATNWRCFAWLLRYAGHSSGSEVASLVSGETCVWNEQEIIRKYVYRIYDIYSWKLQKLHCAALIVSSSAWSRQAFT